MAIDWLLLTGGCYLEVVVRTGLTVYIKQCFEFSNYKDIYYYKTKFWIFLLEISPGKDSGSPGHSAGKLLLKNVLIALFLKVPCLGKNRLWCIEISLHSSGLKSLLATKFTRNRRLDISLIPNVSWIYLDSCKFQLNIQNCLNKFTI